MKIIDCEQGTAEWFDARKGIPTASCFDQIVTPVKGELSKSATKYAYKLIAERLLSRSLDSLEATDWMQRGKDMESTAALWYGRLYERETQRVGLITDDGGTVGCSPDRLVTGAAAAVEIKSPSPAVHLQYLIAAHDADPLSQMPVEYRPQVQGGLYVSDAIETWDFFSFHPEMPPARIIVARDRAYLQKMGDALYQFQLLLIALEERARSLGAFHAYESAATPLDIERADELDRQFRRDFGIAEAGFG